jgi:predicted amidohydrolase
MTTHRIAAAQWPIEALGSFAQWQSKLTRWLTDAADGGAKLCVVPEYASMELTSILAAVDQSTLSRQLTAMQQLLPAYRAAYAELADKLHLTVVAGSFPQWDSIHARYLNVARVFRGAEEFAIEKLQMTRFESEQWGISAGAGQLVIQTPVGLIGVAICYDSEFPMIGRRLAVAGAQLICVPSATDTVAGYHRVKTACAARALENQCFVVQAPTVGSAPWSIAMDSNHGAAGVFAPPDRGFPDDGVIARGAFDASQWLFADLDLACVDEVRNNGTVFVHRDWDLPGHLDGNVRVV